MQGESHLTAGRVCGKVERKNRQEQNMKKKWIALLLCSVMTGSVLAGCSKDEAEGTSQSSSAAAVSETALAGSSAEEAAGTASDTSADAAAAGSAEETEAVSSGSSSGVDTSQVASSADYYATVEREESEMTPITADQIKDGDYQIEVDSSSSMFNVIQCDLHVADGKMTADLTLGGHGYLYLYMGTAEEAAAAPAEDLIGFVENAEGKYVHTVEVEALDKELPCSAFSKRKEKWYERIVVFESDLMPEGSITE